MTKRGPHPKDPIPDIPIKGNATLPLHPLLVTHTLHPLFTDSPFLLPRRGDLVSDLSKSVFVSTRILCVTRLSRDGRAGVRVESPEEGSGTSSKTPMSTSWQVRPG